MTNNKAKYVKIDVYLNDLHHYSAYECRTNSYQTCKQAKASFLAKHSYLSADQVKAKFSRLI